MKKMIAVIGLCLMAGLFGCKEEKKDVKKECCQKMEQKCEGKKACTECKDVEKKMKQKRERKGKGKGECKAKAEVKKEEKK